MIRNDIWGFILKGKKQGEKLNLWQLIVRWILYPISTLKWFLNDKGDGYKFQYDEWIIDGVRISGYVLQRLLESNGQIYQIKRDGDKLIFTRLYAVVYEYTNE